jgi:hypothetical protein
VAAVAVVNNVNKLKNTKNKLSQNKISLYIDLH